MDAAEIKSLAAWSSLSALIMIGLLFPLNTLIALMIAVWCDWTGQGPRGDPLEFQKWKESLELAILCFVGIPMAYGVLILMAIGRCM